jgi:hypothetical protein
MIKDFPHRQLDLTLWIYRKLIILFPIEYQTRFEGELVQLILTQMHEMENDPRMLLTRLWVDWMPDLFVSVIRERIIEMENKMKTSKFVLNSAAFVIMFAWLAFVGLTEAKYFLHLPIKEPTYGLLGESFTSLAYISLTGFLLLAPLLVLVITISPYFKVNLGGSSGNLLEIRIHRVTGISLAVIMGSGAVTLFIFVVFIGSRIL